VAFVRVAGQLLHYRLDGPPGAPALAFLNSLGTDHRIWDALAERWSGRFRLLRYDKRGHGLSDAPDGDYSLDDHVRDLSGLLSALGIERVVPVGVSVGGLIAQAFALAEPDRLSGLVLMDTAARFGDEASWTTRIDAVRAGGMAAISRTVIERWFDESYRTSHADDFAGWLNMLERTPAAGYAGTCATLRDTDLTDRVGRIRMKTLVLAGEADRSTPPELVRKTAELLPYARFELIAGAGHLPNIEAADAVASALDRYFTEIGLV